MKPGSHNDIADYDYYTQIFGDLDKLDESENNPEYLVTERLKKRRRSSRFSWLADLKISY